MSKVKKISKLAGLIMPAFLVSIALFLAFKSYSPGTFLMGWDSLHSEFNLLEAFKRAFFGVWREEQGVGAIAAHGDITELFRILFIKLSSLIIGIDFVRWVFIFLCLILGPLGVYYFLNYVFKREKEGLEVYLASFLGGCFYLLNLATLQHFFVPLEMFPVAFAAIPWLFLFILKILREQKRRNLIIFFVISLFGSSMAYAPALFYAYLGAVFLFLFIYWLSSKFSGSVLKRSLLVVVVAVLTNAFWILPNLYSVKNQSGVISEAKINRLFSPEAFLRNVDFGNINDTLLQRNFLFDWRVFDFEEGTFVDLMEPWQIHLSDERIVWLGYALAALAGVGLLLSITRKSKVGFALLGVLILCLFFLINVNYSTGAIYKYLYENLDLFKEGFRTPFTKFSILFEFILSFFFAYFFFKLFSLFSRKKAFSLLSFILAGAALGGLILFTLPAFKGDFISSVVKTNLPSEYLDVFTWFKGRQGRVAKFPLHTFWGWEYRNWGYEGSGFLTYGLSNPLLDRDFDRWSSENETFYNEISYAFYQGDRQAFEKVLQKYQVKYLLADKSIVNAGGDDGVLGWEELEGFVNASEVVKKVEEFGFLSVYETGFGEENFVSTPSNYSFVDTESLYSQKDVAYLNLGDYINSKEGITYPFGNFDTRKSPDVYFEDGFIRIVGGPLSFGTEKKLITPEILPHSVEDVFINEGKQVEARLTPVELISENFGEGRGFETGQNCDLKKIGTVSKERLETGVLYRAEGGGVSCDFFLYPDLVHSSGYMIRVRGENRQGRSLKLYLFNWKTSRMDIEELLPQGKFDKVFFVLPSAGTEDLDEGAKEISKGYSVNLETRSFGSVASENLVETIEIVPFPYDTLTQIKLTPEDGELASFQGNNLRVLETRKTGTSHYFVDTKGEGLLALGQGYEDGWKAYQVTNAKYPTLTKIFPWWFGDKLTHVKVNSWANGWIVPMGAESLVITFWPQYLEYFGLLLVLVVALSLFTKALRRN